jgi:hypothetical protein
MWYFQFVTQGYGKFLEVGIYYFGHLWITLHVVANEIYLCNKGGYFVKFLYDKKEH